MAKIKFLDLFCGCGGLSYGFIENKNFILKLSADNDESSIQSYKSHIKRKGLNENLALNLDLTKIW
jgi:site-specific DNA-cytosine methylase